MSNPVLVAATHLGWQRFQTATEIEKQSSEEAFKETVIWLLELQEEKFCELLKGSVH